MRLIVVAPLAGAMRDGIIRVIRQQSPRVPTPGSLHPYSIYSLACLLYPF
jgi:hypothetical protein